MPVKVSGDLKAIIVEMSESADRSVSYVVENLLASHHEISPKLEKIRQPEKIVA
jgi:hypothetical protein